MVSNSVPRRLFYTALQWISHRPRSQNTAKEWALTPEKDSTRKRPRSHVSLEKSSKAISRWKNEPNQTSSLTSLHSPPTFLATYFGGFATWWSQNRENFLPNKLAKGGERAGWVAVWRSSLMGWQKPAQFKTRIVSDVLLLSYLHKIGLSLMVEAGQALAVLYSKARLYKGPSLTGLS